MVSVAKKGGVKPDWILSDYWTTMQAYWATPKAKKTSASARASRLSDRNGLGPHRHRAGSCSYAKVQDVLVMFIFPFLVSDNFVLFIFYLFLIVCRKQTTKTSLLLL